jgi:catechol 2,3-dioxygenase-like lactoylglutathione lyase family enzyme
MATVSVGNHSKIVSRMADQARIRAFYGDVLGCRLTKQSAEVDYIRFAEGFFLAVLYQDHVLTEDEARASVWLELRTDDPGALSDQILNFGVHRIEIPGAEHLYFQAPGGQVFRVVARDEDLSRFEK